MRLVLALLIFAVLAPSTAYAGELRATPSTLSSTFAAAQPGDTVVLGSGSYGRFTGGAKAGNVTLRAEPGASMAVDFSAARNLTLDGLTITEATIGGSSSAITIANSTFTGPATVDASSMSNAGIVFDHDRFDGIDACSSCYEGRLSVRGNNNTSPVGVKITNSHFGNGGGSDGVQVIGDAYGVEIGPGNEFSGIKQGSYAAHVDSIQLYGSKYTRIVGNYFHDNDTIIMAPDGGDHEYIANNVMVGDGYVPAVQLGSHYATQFVHNTVRSIDVHADAKSGSSPSRGVVVSDNVFHNGSTNATGSLCSGCTVSYNLFTARGKASGANAIVGSPVFAGGPSPASWDGYGLAAGSPGKGNASDGKDRGIDLSGGGPSGPPSTPPAPAAPAPHAPAAPAQPAAPSGGQAGGKRAKAARIRVVTRTRKVRVGRRVLLKAPKSKQHGRKCFWTLSHRVTRKGCTIAVRFHRAGRHHVALRMTYRSGRIVRSTGSVRVLPRRH